jgi:hypothetical protein
MDPATMPAALQRVLDLDVGSTLFGYSVACMCVPASAALGPRDRLFIPRTAQILRLLDGPDVYLLSRVPAGRPVAEAVGAWPACAGAVGAQWTRQIFGIWLLDSLHTAFLAACLYIIVVTTGGNPMKMSQATWYVPCSVSGVHPLIAC